MLAGDGSRSRLPVFGLDRPRRRRAPSARDGLAIREGILTSHCNGAIVCNGRYTDSANRVIRRIQ